ncbi:MAG: DUF7064 domain-containing protein [Acidimicrobiales bacterium]
MAKLRFDPEDEYTHALEETVNFNESMYFNVYDPVRRVGGFFRVGNRANEGYAEMTVCLYLPDGRVAFMFGRPTIDDNASFSAAGMSFSVVEPFKELKVGYEGKVVMLDDPLAMAHPKRAFTENPWVECKAELTFRGVSPMLGGEMVADDGSPLADTGQGFARAHYEQHTAGAGSLQVGDDEWVIDGFGLRDHSWGPRYWQSPWWYRWLTANCGPDLGFMISVIASRDGSKRKAGVVLRDGAYESIHTVEVDTDWAGEDMYHSGIRATAVTAGGTYEITGKVLSLVPLRNRRQDNDGTQLVTRISEGLTEWTCNGAVGYGLSEYLDQIVDGKPVGSVA